MYVHCRLSVVIAERTSHPGASTVAARSVRGLSTVDAVETAIGSDQRKTVRQPVNQNQKVCFSIFVYDIIKGWKTVVCVAS